MTTSTAPSASPRVVEGIALYERGPSCPSSRPPIVLVHGGMHGAWIWTDVQDQLAADGWTSVAFDWFSHGRSAALPREQWVRRSITEVTREIAVACAAADDGDLPPVVVGHSMGGLAALAHAAAHPPRLGAVVLLAPVVPRQFSPAPITVPGLDPEAPYGPFPPAVAHELFFDGLSEDEAGRWSARLQAESPTAVDEATRFTARVDLARLSVPVLALGAERDRLVDPNAVRALAQSIAGDYVQLPGGHGIPVNPGWPHVLAMITAWIELATGPHDR